MAVAGITDPGAPPPWAGRRVLVTGCTGFLGCWLSRALCDQGAWVAGLVRSAVPDTGTFHLFGLPPRVAAVRGDVEDFAVLVRALVEHEVDTVFHLAARTPHVLPAVPRAMFEANIRGTWNVLEAVRVAPRPARVIVASSDQVYGDAPELPATEDMPLRGHSPYQVSKVATEMLVQSYHRVHGVAACSARLGNVYGGGDLNFMRLVPGTIRSVLLGEAPVLRSNGRMLRDYLHVEDAVRGFLALAEAMREPGLAGEGFNITTGTPASVLEVVEAILRIAGREDLAPRILDRVAGEVPAKYASPLKARKAFGWSAGIPLEAGLRRTLEWYATRWPGRPSPAGRP